MPKITVTRNIDPGSFGIPQWTDDQHRVPLVLQVTGATARIFIKTSDHLHAQGRKKIDFMPRGFIELVFDPAPQRLMKGLRTKSGGEESAKQIYKAYREAMQKLEALLLSAANLKYMYWLRVIGESEFFSNSFIDKVSWSVDGGPFSTFSPKLTRDRRLNPMFKSDQLVTFEKWEKLQDAADNQSIPEGELLELYRIRTKTHFNQGRTAAIEASIISETLLRDYGAKVLKSQGFSRTKVKKIRDELTFNNLLNIVLPLSLSKTDFGKISKAVAAVDELRRLRNDIVHGNIDSSPVDRNVVADGIEGAIRLVNFLKAKIEAPS